MLAREGEERARSLEEQLQREREQARREREQIHHETAIGAARKVIAMGGLSDVQIPR